uniref:NADH dehydrogenase [ubiquinone] 1 alpha subcomplex subunit 1 n=1 Tax=Camellia sinensis TaxID=4442 RepID=F4YFA5_CAMSI|nr:hypothetical protein [Camellia sinensis]
MGLQWLEAALPLGIIAGMLCIMGNAQYYIHKVAHGRPKHVGNDVWDVAMERRDKKLIESLFRPQISPHFWKLFFNGFVRNKVLI